MLPGLVEGADSVCVSALITPTHMPSTKPTQTIYREGVRQGVLNSTHGDESNRCCSVKHGAFPWLNRIITSLAQLPRRNIDPLCVSSCPVHYGPPVSGRKVHN